MYVTTYLPVYTGKCNCGKILLYWLEGCLFEKGSFKSLCETQELEVIGNVFTGSRDNSKEVYVDF